MLKPQDDSETVSLRAVIRARALNNPSANALLAPNSRPMTYGQLSDQIEYVGQTLRKLGIGRTDRVAVALPNGPDMAAAFLGVAACATCVPLNPRSPDDQFRFYLADADATAVVVPANTDLAARDVATELGLTMIELEASQSGLAGAFRLLGFPPEVETQTDWGTDDDVALILHTSGTTSRPKQVPLSHRNLYASACSVAATLALSGDDISLNVMPLFHIHGLVGVLLSSIVSGGSVACSNGYDEVSFGALMSDFMPTWYSAVPTIHQSVLALANKNPEIANTTQLRFIRSSSASLPPAVMCALEDRFQVPVIEAYGMTEAAHQMASNPLPPAERKPASVGLPAGPEMAIMDDEGRLLPGDQTGEIVIRGPNVTAGYANTSADNASCFTDGWLRTGDRGNRDEDGYYFITGRTKEMINRGGETIAPREIDDALLEHPGVAEAVAFAVPHPTLEEDVAAAIVLRGASEADEQELRRFAFERLAPAKVPSRIVIVESLPKGPTGKLKRIGLHEDFEYQLNHAYVEPRTDLEKDIVATMELILETKPIGAADNFFARGGDSLKANRVVAALCSNYQVELPAVALFHHPSAEQLGLEITRLMAEDLGTLDELLAEIESMSDDDARGQLS